MALGHRLELRQGQGLVITPQLQQAIKLLQLSNLELDAFVEAELERNPLLQRDDGPAETDRASEEIAERPPENLGLDAVSDSAASQQMDAAPDDVSPGERATGD
ncbi:MAG TPA: RNA polymerase sigma-54 factor, partial [Caulobacter sp.]|nr:RNA polymerase sigma-54 factor [Caulobacter sp.]